MSHRAHKCLKRCLSSQVRYEGQSCPSPLCSSCSTCRAWIHREEKKKSKTLNGKKQGQQATGCTWPWEGWLVGSRKWRERRRGRSDFWIAAVFGWKKKSYLDAQIYVVLFFPQAGMRWRGSLPRQGLSAVVAGTAISIAVITASRHFVLMPERPWE